MSKRMTDGEIEDAILMTKDAIEDGFVVGTGNAYDNAIKLGWLWCRALVTSGGAWYEPTPQGRKAVANWEAF